MRRVEWWAAPVALVVAGVAGGLAYLAFHLRAPRTAERYRVIDAVLDKHPPPAPAPRRLSDRLRAEGVLGEATEYGHDWRSAA